MFMSAEIIQFSCAPGGIASRRIFQPSRSALSCTISPRIWPNRHCANIANRKNTKRKMSKTKTIAEIRSLARSHTKTAINVLAGIMRSKDVTAAARVSAANALLDRGWGKATQPVGGGDDGALELIHRIERVIVHPENPDR
jgi:hypothetical protein